MFIKKQKKKSEIDNFCSFKDSSIFEMLQPVIS